MSQRVTIHAGINGRTPSEALAFVDLDHPETAARDIAKLLRDLADAFVEDEEFTRVLLEGLFGDEI